MNIIADPRAAQIQAHHQAAHAHAAMLGVELHRQDDGRGSEVFIATRAPLTKCFDTLAGFLEWLGKVEAR